MKKTCMMIVGVAGLASAASAQNTFSLSLFTAAPTVDTTGGEVTFDIDVVGDASIGTHMLGGAFALQSNSDLVVDMSWASASWDSFPTDGGYAGNGNYNQVIFGQLVIPGVPPFDVPAAGSELGSLIGTYSVTLAANAMGIIDFSLVPQDPFSLEVLDVDSGLLYRSSDGELVLEGVTIITPAPSALALLGVSGLVCARRRR